MSVLQSGLLGTSYLFDGINGKVTSNAAFNSFPVTISMWVNSDNSADIMRFSTHNTVNFYGLQLAVVFSNGQFVLAYGDGNGTGSENRRTYVTGSTSATNGTGWHHILVIVDSLFSHTLYIDGVEETLNFSSGAASSCDLSAGNQTMGQNWGNAAYGAGYKDQIAIWNRELSPSEKDTLYNSGSGLAYTSW